LEFAYLPFDDVVFDRAFFDTPDMKFPASYFVDKVKEIKGDTSDDSRSSHPSAGKRREKVSARITANSKTEDKKDFIVSQTEFLWCRDKSRMEIAHLLLLNRRYEEAIYHTYLLMKKNPQSKYLKKIMAKALYGLSKYKSEDKFYKVHVDHDKIEGESQQVYFFFNTLSASELSALANGYLWNLRKDYPEDLEVKMMSDDLMNNMVQKHYPDKSYFIRNPLDFQKEEVAENNTFQDTTSKYAKIKKKLKAVEDTTATSYEFIRYAFVDQFKNKEFESAYDRFSDAKKAADNLSPTQRLAIEAGKEKEKKRFRKKGYALGVDRVVLIDPFYARINTKRKEAYRFQFTEEKKTELGKLLKEAGEDVGVQTESLIPVEMTAAEVEKMNDYALMEEWIHERLEHDDLDSVFVSPMQYEASLLSKKYGTAHFGWSGMVWYTERNSNLAGLYMISILYPFVLPYAVYETFTPSHRTLQYTLLYDLNTGKEKMHYVQFFKNKDVSKFTSAGLYYTFLQIKTRAK
jgi:beta-barrel assembly-enhancing protease